ncbi:glycosyl hydrolase family 28-related protein [Emticicia sp. BO119]|uniref:right-handed parallel beta-helix repeat-containing protein n=1 Tax=Emticicia sp. BO119 TaxID=2757768 RepID=UPI0015EFF229|nr:glycosyl hydrolase family 28-related protein [Emticicia sp. BO119]MBA4848949.1 right-handed parallel beta-helix repeat-containing protein [Emticicia sp. BO119]
MNKVMYLFLLIATLAFGQVPKKNSVYVSVKSFGAKGDGKTDDKLAIQAAIDVNAHVYFPDGIYIVNDELIIDKKITVLGSKNAKIIKNFTAPNTALLKCRNSDIEISGLKIEGITQSKFVQNEYSIHVVGNASNNYTRIRILNNTISEIGHGAICVEYCKDFLISGNRISNINSTGIEVLSSEKGIITRNTVRDIITGSAGTAYGIIMSLRLCDIDLPSKNIAVKNNVVDNVPLWEGIDTHAGQDIQIIGNTILNCAYGINASKCNNNSSMVPQNIIISNNIIKKGTVKTPGRGIGSGGSSSMYAGNIVVSNNTIDGYGIDNNSEGAIMFYSTKKLQIRANTITNSLSSGINIQNRNEDYLVSKNKIRKINKGTTNAAGIIIRNEGQSGIVQDNYVDADKELGMMVYGKGSNYFKNNTFLAGKGKYKGAEHVKGLELIELSAKDLPPIDAHSVATFTINVNAAREGDKVSVSIEKKIAYISVEGYVSATNVITIKVENNSGKKIDLPLMKYTVKVTKL